MKLILIGLAFLAAFASAQLPDPRCPPDNPRPPVHLPHPTDCSLFFLCSFGIAHLMPPCPPGLLFDTPSSSCRPAADARCGEQPPTVPPPTTEPPIEPPTEPETEPPIEPETEPPTTLPPDTTVSAIPTAPPIIPTAPPFPRRFVPMRHRLIKSNMFE